jgi:hypothetical protein
MIPFQYKQIKQRPAKICEYKATISQNVNTYYNGGEEGSYTNSYKYCGKLKKRLTTRSCINCVFFKPKL